jgi:hypothetical protein
MKTTDTAYNCTIHGKRLDFFVYSYWSNEPGVSDTERLAIYHNSRHAADGRLISLCHKGFERNAIESYINEQLDPNWCGRIARN